MFKQFIPSKRHRIGVKVFVLCDCETGYILDFILYTGATTDIVEDRELGISGAVVQIKDITCGLTIGIRALFFITGYIQME
jgi:hypothetical protein